MVHIQKRNSKFEMQGTIIYSVVFKIYYRDMKILNFNYTHTECNIAQNWN